MASVMAFFFFSEAGWTGLISLVCCMLVPPLSLAAPLPRAGAALPPLIAQADQPPDSEFPPESEDFEIEGLDEDFQSEDFQLDGEETDMAFAEEEAEEPSQMDELLAPARISLGYIWGVGTEEPRDVVVNRTSLRLEWERLLGENYFLRLDAKARLFASNDHQTRALGDDKEYSTDSRLRELYLQNSVSDLSFKAGRQIVIWGEAEGSAGKSVV